MKLLSNKNSIFIELGVFETRFITNFNDQRVVVNRFQDEFIQKIYPIDESGKFSSYENLRYFFEHIFSLIQGQGFFSRFVGLKAYVLVDVDTQVESEAILDSLSSQNVRKIQLIGRSIKELRRYQSQNLLNLDINGCDLYDMNSKKYMVDEEFKLKVDELYRLAINQIKLKYLIDIKDESLFKNIYFHFKTNRPIIEDPSLENEFNQKLNNLIERNVIQKLQKRVFEYRDQNFKFSGNFFANKDISVPVVKLLKIDKKNMETSPTYLLELIKEGIH